MISDNRLEEVARLEREFITFPPSHFECAEMAKELLALRPCRHNWNVIRLVEAGGRYQYCTLCGAKKVAE
jgi:hypothetical protein